jgi:hypothetical protein
MPPYIILQEFSKGKTERKTEPSSQGREQAPQLPNQILQVFIVSIATSSTVTKDLVTGR